MQEGRDFSVRFWGVRGSIPCPGAESVKYGGNTSCLEIRCGPHVLIFDGGTGLRLFDKSWADAAALDADLFFTHTHLDHICGWPYFTRLSRPETALTVWCGNLLPDHGIEGVLGDLLREPFVPVRLDRLHARITYNDFHAGETVEPRADVRIRTAPLNHPQGATGYRVEYGGRSICYVTDTEHAPGEPDQNILGLIEGADLFIYDCTYTDDEFPAHVNWGHSTWQEGARLADAARVKTFVVFHHDPDHNDAFMDAVARDVEAARRGSVVACEGMTLRP
ncbi:MAG: MBL fold metallo-hydrolase [Proteobacteria bacterium]|nr:MBL fold metallo-hydrolase [Pseudomonadota bacterium]